MGKAANGMGNIRKRADGRWEGRYTDTIGVQRSVYAKTKSDCAAKLRAKQCEVDTSSYVVPNALTVEEWMRIWLNEYCRHVRPSTMKTYQIYGGGVIVQELGALRLDKLTTLQAQRFINRLTDVYHFSPSTVNLCGTLIGNACKCAAQAHLINGNPFDNVKYPKDRGAKPMNIIEAENIPAFLDAIRGRWIEGISLLMLYTGLRVSEAVGLKWSDVDYERHTLLVERQYNGRAFAPTKSGKARTVILPDAAISVLREERRRQMEARIASGEWTDTEITADMVFRRERTGKPFNANSVTIALKSVGEKIGMPTLHSHDLRHSYAVSALRAGVDVKTVQSNLGHASAAMTLDIYACYTDHMRQEATERLNRYFSR